MTQRYQIQLKDSAKHHLSTNLLGNLALVAIPIPIPGPGSVLIRVRAVSLNFRDLLVLADSPLYPIRTTSGLVPCIDGAGEVVGAGQDSLWKNSIGTAVIFRSTTDWDDGDVSALHLSNALGAGNVNGTLSQYLVMEDAAVVQAPQNLTFEESSTITVAGGAAINTLTSVQVDDKTTVVTQGTGGVSCWTIQFAAALGAKVIATSSSNEKLKVAEKLGASELINYKAVPNWADEVLRLTNGTGADLVADVGGSQTIEQSIKALRQGGTACIVGDMTEHKPISDDFVMSVLQKAVTLKGILSCSKAMLERAVKLIEEHDIHPQIGHVYEWEEAPKAFESLRSQNFVGKIVIKV